MKVLHAYRTYFPDTQGGLEEAIRQICLATIPYGAEHTIWTVSDAPEPAELVRPEGRVVRAKKLVEIASCGFATPAGTARFAELARGHDLIHYHAPWPFADMLQVGLRPDRPALITYQSDVVRQKVLGAMYRPLMRRFIASVQALVVTSPNYLRSSEDLAPFASRATIIPNTIDPASYPAVEPARAAGWAARFGGPFFLFVGVLRYYKGLHHLLEAAALTKVPVAIVGDGPEGPALRAAAAARGLRHVHFLGRVDDHDKVALLDACRGIVFPSHLRSEAFGMTLLEGAQHARPLISCEIGTGTSYINADGETGIVVPPADPPALARAMERLAADDALARSMGEAALRRFRALFSSEAVGGAYAGVYRSLSRSSPT